IANFLSVLQLLFGQFGEFFRRLACFFAEFGCGLGKLIGRFLRGGGRLGSGVFRSFTRLFGRLRQLFFGGLHRLQGFVQTFRHVRRGVFHSFGDLLGDFSHVLLIFRQHVGHFLCESLFARRFFRDPSHFAFGRSGSF